MTILPVWTTTYFPSQDGPVHLYIVHLMEQLLAGDDGIVARYFELNPYFEPNFAFYGFALALAPLFDLLVVEKLYLSVLALASCLAVRLAVRSVNPAAGVYSLLAVPTAFHYFVHMGFYNFSLGIAATLFGLTICLRRLDRPTAVDLAVIGLVAMAVLAVHLMAFMVLLVCLGLALGWRTLTELIAERAPREAVIVLGRRALGLGLALLPALALTATFFVRHGLNEARADEGVGHNSLLAMTTLISFDASELWLMAPWIALFYFLGAYTLFRHLRAGSLRQAAFYALLPAALVLLFFGNPFTAANLRVADRFMPFIIALGFLWFATVTPSRWLARLVVAVAVTTTVVSAGQRFWQYERYGQHIRDYLAIADGIAPGHTLLPLHLTPGREVAGDWFRRPDPLMHLGAHLAREQDLVYMRGSLLSRHVFGYFPAVYRETTDPFLHIEHAERLDGELRDVRFVDFGARSESRLDYLLLWPAPVEALDDPISEAIRAQVAEYWRPVTLPSAATGELFRRLTECETMTQPTVASDRQPSDRQPSDRRHCRTAADGPAIPGQLAAGPAEAGFAAEPPPGTTTPRLGSSVQP